MVAAKDDRSDKLKEPKAGETQAAAPKPQQGASPKIVSTEAQTLTQGQARALVVKGTNFNNYKVKVNNGPEVDPEQPTHESFRIQVAAEQTKGG